MRSQHRREALVRRLARKSRTLKPVDGDTKCPVAEVFSSARRAAPSLGSRPELQFSARSWPATRRRVRVHAHWEKRAAQGRGLGL